MKNLLFGIIATVMFGNLGFGSSLFKITTNSKIYPPYMYCANVAISVGAYGVGISIGNRICCAYRNVHSPGVSCWVANKSIGVLHFEDLEPTLLGIITKNKLTELEIKDSSEFLSEDKVKFKITKGTYKIITNKDGNYIEVFIEKV